MKKDSNTSAIERVQKELSDYIANRNKEKADIDAEKAKIEELKKQEAECFDEDAFLKIRADIRTSEDKLAFLQKLASQPEIDESKIAASTKALAIEQNALVADALAKADKHALEIKSIMDELKGKLDKIQALSDSQRSVYKTVYEVQPAIYHEPTGKLSKLLNFRNSYFFNAEE